MNEMSLCPGVQVIEGVELTDNLIVLFPLVVDGQMYYGYCINCLYPAMGDA